MGNFSFSVPALGSKFVDYRQPIVGDSFNWSWVRPMSQVQYIAIHHSAGPDSQTPDDIARYHVQSRGWGGVGYHFIVSKNGTVYYVGDLTTARAHVLNQNHLAIGICLIGNFMAGKEPTSEQITSVHELCAQMLFRTPELPGVDGWEDVIGHKRLVATACPGETWDNWRAKIILAGTSPTPTPTPTPTPDTNRVQAVTQLYRVVLGREPDASGLQHHVNSNQSIDQIRTAMTESVEHQHILNKAKNLKDAVRLAEEAKQALQTTVNKLNEISSLNI